MKKMFILIFLLIHIAVFAASNKQLAWAETTLYLDFDEASYYEFGFSNTPVYSGGSPSTINTGAPLLKTAENGLTAGSIKSEPKKVYAYWNIVSSTSVTLYLEMGGKLFPANAPENYEHGIDWTVSRVSENGSTSEILNSKDKKTEKEFVKINATLGTTSEADASERVGSVELRIQAEHEGPVSEMIAGTYTGTLTLGVVSNG